jgi:NAD(P)-dependent dehydrogenase (short-subunit alcohol dehydrogenase family)
MRIIVLGASGKIGTEIVEAMPANWDVVSAGRRSGDVQVDYANRDSVQSMYESVGSFDSLVSVVGGDSVFKSFEELTDGDFEVGFRRKFLAQLNLVRIGSEFINDGGSFTLSSGYLSHYPNPSSIATGPFNAAVDTMVANVAPLLPKNIRLNVVSPAPIVPPERVGRGLLSAEQAAHYYLQCINGDFTGQVIKAWGGLE